MLTGQDLGRGHQGALPAIGRAQIQGQKCQDRLAGSHIALQPAVHEPGTCQIPADLVPGLFLSLRQDKGQALREGLHFRPVLHGPCIDQFLPGLLLAADRQDELEKFIKDQSSSGFREFFHIHGEMDLPVRLPEPCQVQKGPVLLRDIILRKDILLQDLPHCLFHLIVLQASGQGIAGLHGALDPRVGSGRINPGLFHIEKAGPGPSQRAPEIMAAAHRQGIPDIGHIEPGQTHLGPLPGGFDMDDPAGAAAGPDRPAADGQGKGHGPTGQGIRRPDRRVKRFIIDRIISQQVPGRMDASGIEQLRCFGPDPLQICNRCILVHMR